nr:hypothetical protein [uncultured Halomonas sp.]
MSPNDSTFFSDKLTPRELARALAQGLDPIVEVASMDGVYIVRLHHANGISELCDSNGNTCTYMGTGKIREVLGNMGLKNGVLTWSDQCGDEMIGCGGQSVSQEEMLLNGTRISFR